MINRKICVHPPLSAVRKQGGNQWLPIISTAPKRMPSGTTRFRRASDIQPGDTVVFETLEASANQITPQSTAADVGRLDFGNVNPLTGPVFVEGAQPGDALEVEMLSLKHKGWGWNAVIPGFGLLADEFPNPISPLQARPEILRVPPGHPDPVRAVLRRDGRGARRARADRHDPAARERRQPRHPPPDAWHARHFPGLGARRAVLLRRLPRGPGRRRGQRHRD